MTVSTVGKRALGLATAVVTAAMVASAVPAAATAGGPPGTPDRALRAPLPDGLGPCVPGDCPDPYPEIGNGAIAGRDNGINVYVGGDFQVRRGAVEAEGRVVVLGDFDQNKARTATASYFVGIAGVGSRVPPPVGADFLTTGGDVTVATGQTLVGEGGVIRYVGALTGNVTGTKTKDPAAADPYRGIRANLTRSSNCYAEDQGKPRPATGTVTKNGDLITFKGDAKSALQVFTVDFDLVGPNAGGSYLSFTDIPAGATVLVNVTGTFPTLNVNNGDFPKGLREKLLWNFPYADAVALKGGAQFVGSTLIGKQNSTATVSMIGMNGRFFTAGNLIHTSPTDNTGFGAEFHAYPFTGDLPRCVVTIKPPLVIRKEDADTGAPLAGAKFELWRETNGTPGLQTDGATPDTKVGQECTTDDTGTCSIRRGDGTSFYWRETAAPPGYELSDPDVIPVVLTPGDEDETVTTVAMNKKKREPAREVPLKVLKTDADTGKALPGARFELWRESNDTEGLQTGGATPDTKLPVTCVTDAKGGCSATVETGHTYYWRETAAPGGYDLPRPAVFPVTVAADAPDAGVTVTAANHKTPFTGSLKVLKKDAKTGRPLAGAVFELWRESNGTKGLQTTGARPDTRLGDGCATDRQGVCVYPGLAEGWYYLLETDVPEGYKLPANRVTGPLELTRTTPGKQVVVTLANERDDHGKDGKG
ncbi:choice-of-anchor A family protein [Streptomyces sp. BI20]|uniref:choice-of-anchor A family protein n=1 Tax=Streptomyces sp. BI20 TaxID=3403460 RepID=UPI003C753931